MAQQEYIGVAVGKDADGKDVPVTIYKSGRSWFMDGPGPRKAAHPSRKDLAGVLTEIELVYGLSDVVVVSEPGAT